MSNGEQDIYLDTLFVGMTRPATMWGIPFVAFIVEILSTALVFLAVGDIIFIFIAVPIHATLYAISASDPGKFASLALWLNTNGRCRNSSFWGSASFSPMSVKKWIK